MICMCCSVLIQVCLGHGASSFFVISLEMGIKSEKNDAIDAIIDSQLPCVSGRRGRPFPSTSYLRGTSADLLLGILACALQMEVFPPLIQIPFMENSSRACTSHLQHSYCLTVLFCSSPSAQRNPDCLLQC